MYRTKLIIGKVHEKLPSEQLILFSFKISSQLCFSLSHVAYMYMYVCMTVYRLCISTWRVCIVYVYMCACMYDA